MLQIFANEAGPCSSDEDESGKTIDTYLEKYVDPEAYQIVKVHGPVYDSSDALFVSALRM